MKNTNIDHEITAKKKGRKVSALIHIVFLGLLAFPFLQMATPEITEDVQIVMDFSSGSRAEGAKASKKRTTTAKSIEKPRPVETKPVIQTKVPEKVVVKEAPKADSNKTATPEPEVVDNSNKDIPDSQDSDESGIGGGETGKGDAEEGSATSGNGRGFIEGTGALTRAVIDRGNTKALAQQNGTLMLKICINRRGVVTFAEWDKEASTIKNAKVARTALDNVLNYKFESDRNAPKKECGRLTYIIDVD